MVDQTLLPTEHVEIECRDVADGLGGDQVVARARSAGHRSCSRLWSGHRRAVAGLRRRCMRCAVRSRRPARRFERAGRQPSICSGRSTAWIVAWPRTIETTAAPCWKSCWQRPERSTRKIDRCAVQSADTALPLVQPGHGVLTHCNAGGLATADYGTALAVIFAAHEQGTPVRVYADETRPLLQGARLTAWELKRRGIPVTLICDNMAAQVMREGKVQMVVVGADRIASNGDTANKIGTYGVAVLAQAHGIPFYVAAPSSTFDLSIPDGAAIPIEQRDPREVTHGFGRQTAPAGIEVYNPAFDVTPAALIAGIITEKGVISPVNEQTIRRVLGSS